MKFMDKIKFALRDLVNRKGRSLLTIIAVAIGALLLIVLLGVGDGVITKMKEMVESFGDINAVYVYPVDAEKAGDPMQVSMGGEQGVDLKEVEGDETAEKQNEKKQDENFKKLEPSDLSKISDVEGVKKLYVAIQGSVTSYKLDNG